VVPSARSTKNSLSDCSDQPTRLTTERLVQAF
jgi:hypothetical protein